MSTISEASVPTTQGLKYVRQLCQHWAHNLALILNELGGGVVFPANARGTDWPGDAVIIMAASADLILCRIESSAEGQLDGLRGVLARRLGRFTF
jgi:uncharacterized protein